MNNVAALAAKFALNHRGRGRKYYLREIARPWIWRGVRMRHAGITALCLTRRGWTWHLPLADDEIASHIYVHGEFNEGEVARVIDYLDAEPALRDMIGGTKGMLDIGANYGSASLYFGRSGKFREIHAIEPDPVNFAILKQNITANGLTGIIRAHRIALNDRDGTAILNLSERNLGDHYIGDGVGDLETKSERAAASVACLTLDSFLEKNRIEMKTIGLIWIDVQGHEGHILGSSEKLRANPVPIHAEIWPYGLNRSGGMDRFLHFAKTAYGYFIELETKRPRRRSIAELENLIKSLGSRGRFTDILIHP
jgi:FkbM family methyltransferase